MWAPVRENIMESLSNIRREKVLAAFIFSLTAWALLYLWLYLVHTIDEKVASTTLSSPLVHASITSAVLAFIFQKKPGALRELAIIVFWLVLIFIYSIIVFNILLNTVPGIYDIVFYYECFLLIVFCGSPVYLLMRMI